MSGGNATLACYRVTISTADRPWLPWTMAGGDQVYREGPVRRVRPVIAATSRQAARERARELGRQMLGGRGVVVEAVEDVHPIGAHRNERIGSR